MTSTSEYPELDQLFGAYLNQDYDLSGDTIEEVVASYMQGTSTESHGRMLDEIVKFEQAHSDNLDQALLLRYGNDFDPELWGHTAASFLQLLDALVRGQR